MDKWRCIPCGYIYDPDAGDSDGGIAPERLSKTYRKTGSALCVALQRTSSRKSYK